MKMRRKTLQSAASDALESQNGESPVPDVIELEPKKIKVLQGLLRGETVTSAAERASVHRATVHRWKKDDLAFQATLNRGKQEIVDASDAVLAMIARHCAINICQSVMAGDAKISLQVLRGLGYLSGKRQPIGSGDPEDLKEQQHRKKSLDALFDI